MRSAKVGAVLGLAAAVFAAGCQTPSQLVLPTKGKGRQATGRQEIVIPGVPMPIGRPGMDPEIIIPGVPIPINRPNNDPEFAEVYGMVVDLSPELDELVEDQQIAGLRGVLVALDDGLRVLAIDRNELDLQLGDRVQLSVQSSKKISRKRYAIQKVVADSPLHPRLVSQNR